LTHRYENLSRLGGGIGTRGPGETQLESDRRVIKKKISILRKRIKEVAEHRDLQRQGRQRKLQQVVSIVGYTNSGKSTLLQALSKKTVYIKDQLFATLDPVIRTVYIKNLNKEILFSDTVGFIKNLPHHLIDSFRSTLEEVVHADLILHVVDAAATDYKRQIDTVFEVLHSLQATDKKIITVFNKLDLKPELTIEQLREEYAPAVFISALQKQGVEDLLAVVADLLK
jgi:GTP-binding protein HflX